MRPVNKAAAIGLSNGSSPGEREERVAPVAFGRPSSQPRAPVAVRRRTKTKYQRPQLSEDEEQTLINRVISHLIVAGRVVANAEMRARTLVIDELAIALGPHQVATLRKHPPYERALQKILALLV